MIKYLILSSLSMVYADHECYESVYTDIDVVTNFDFRIEGYNRLLKLVVAPGKTCSLNFDQYSTYSKMYTLADE